jgi:cell division protein FtsI (penicillin-binding protein 3)
MKKGRLLSIGLFLFFLFSLLVVQFFKIQIIEGEKWSKAADAQHQFTVIEPFKRGLFYSNASIKAGHPEMPKAFVIDIPKYDLYADPQQIPSIHRQEITNKLLQYVPKKEGKKLAAQFEKHSRSRKLIMWLEQEQMQQIQEWWFSFAKRHKLAKNALFFIKDYKRSYPFGPLLGNVLHTVRALKDPKTHQAIPTGGLELIFDKMLQGKEGKRCLLRSPRHPMQTGKILTPAEDGADIYLTINDTLQAIAEEEIAKAVKQAGAQSGWAILMEPHTGEVWALAQSPSFDPTDYKRYFNDPLFSEHTKVHAVTDPFEPGSIMKPLTIALALKASKECVQAGKKPLFSIQEKVATAQGGFPGRSKPIHDTKRHAYLNMAMAMQKSSNIYVARIIQRVIDALGEEWYRDALQNVFGFGIKTGVELPSETPGMLPTPGKLHPNGKMEWSTPTPFSIAFGHNILASSFQMLRCYGILANGGFDVKPTLVRKIVRKGEVILDNTVPQRGKSKARLLDPEIVETVVKAMKYVTKPGGSATKADIPGYSEAGKTATTEKIVNGAYSKKNHISTFLGFAPVAEPRFVLMIVIDEPEYKFVPGVGKIQHGGNCAGPAFREIGLKTLQYLGVTPDDKGQDWMKEVKELKELYTQWNLSN